jgi:hypothetical protein
MLKKKKKITVGRCELVGFPELNLAQVNAKIDTGAYSTALHCYDVYEMREGKEKILCFKVLDPSFSKYSNQEIQYKQFTRKKIKSSSGEKETRYIIKTKIAIGGRLILTDVSLADRGNMKYPVLIGRKLLSKGFLVDVTKVNLLKEKS